MAKFKLVYEATEYPNFMHGVIAKEITPFFDIEAYDPTKTYNQSDTAVLTTHCGVLSPEPRWYQRLEEQGLRVVVDHLWDSDTDMPTRVVNGHLILRNVNWVWMRECFWWTQLKYNEYIPNRQRQFSFVMQMHKLRDHRDRAAKDLASVLDTALWSYVERGIYMLNDCNHATGHNGIFWEFYCNPWWYDNSAFSVVVESWMRSDVWARCQSFPNYKTEVSEKIFKPFAFKHPFIVYGSFETLAYLKREGFVTYNNLFDESYDSVINDEPRFEATTKVILDAVNDWKNYKNFYDKLTEEKIEHNFNRFYDINYIRNKFQNEVVKDIREFLE